MLKQRTSDECLSCVQNNSVLAVGLVKREEISSLSELTSSLRTSRQTVLALLFQLVNGAILEGASSPSSALLVQPGGVWSNRAEPNSGGGKNCLCAVPMAATVSTKNNDFNSMDGTSTWTP